MADDGSGEGDNPDIELVTRIRHGDGGAEVRLMAAYLPGIRTLARKHCRANDPVLDDVVQEVLMRVLVHLRAGELREGEALPAYVRSMVANIAIAEYRRRERNNDGGDGIGTLVSDDSPEDNVDREHRSGLVIRLLAELPVARDREILMRHYVQAQAQEQICAEMGIDPGLYRRVLHRARDRLCLLAERRGLRSH